jgi:hypothetical protein
MSAPLTSPVDEVCSSCGVEFCMGKSVEDCPHCGVSSTACHACRDWLEETQNACFECMSGSRFVEGEH